jgi:hypothetical protein
MPKNEGVSAINEEARERNLDIRNVLGDAGLVVEGDRILPDDFQTIHTRAENLMGENPNLDRDTALSYAYCERMMVTGRSAEIIERASDELLSAIMTAHTGEQYTNEEVGLFKRFIEGADSATLTANPIKQWSDARNAARGSLPTAGYVAVGSQDDVLARGKNPVDAIQEARKEE